jgi:hypothetical protein
MPSDANPGRPYQIVPIFDVEPYALTLWETQESDDGVPGYKTWMWANVVLASTATVTMTMIIQRSQSGDGNRVTRTYSIPSTAGVKLNIYVPFVADKGVLVKYQFSSSASHRLYREESSVVMQPWGAAQPVVTHPFGNDDLTTPTRDMINAGLAASRSGGGAG